MELKMMNNRASLLLLVLFLYSCGANPDKSNENNSATNQETTADTLIPQPMDSTDSLALQLKATFVEFHLGDAEHYLFKDEEGKTWDFAGCEAAQFDFTRELSEAEADESNQGWGSNKDLQGKWFQLSYINQEQPLYMDGPMATVSVITSAIIAKK
jgi:hypothetical protein